MLWFIHLISHRGGYRWRAHTVYRLRRTSVSRRGLPHLRDADAPLAGAYAERDVPSNPKDVPRIFSIQRAAILSGNTAPGRGCLIPSTVRGITRALRSTGYPSSGGSSPHSRECDGDRTWQVGSHIQTAACEWRDAQSQQGRGRHWMSHTAYIPTALRQCPTELLSHSGSHP